MKELYSIVKSYVFTGIYGYALFGFYALIVSPLITQFISYGEKNMFVAIFGFIMLVAEFFALNFKLKMVRIHTEEKRLEYKRQTGIDIVPRPGKLVVFGLFMRIGLRLIVIMVCLNALGYTSNEKEMDPFALLVFFLWFFVDMCGLIYIYLTTGFYREPIENERELSEENKEIQEWNKTNLPLASTKAYYWKELASDIILQIYAVMLFTALWTYINQIGINMLNVSVSNHDSAIDAAMYLFPMLFFLVILAIMPIRIAYWIEDSMMAFTKKEKLAMWIIFFFVGLFTCAPCIIEFSVLYVIRSATILSYLHSKYLNLFLTIFLLALILTVQIILYKKQGKTFTLP